MIVPTCSIAALRFLHNVVLEKEGGVVVSTFDSSFGGPTIGSATTSSSKEGDEAGKDSKRRLTFACPVVSIGSSKVAGLTGRIGGVGQSRANGKGICEHKLETGSSIP